MFSITPLLLLSLTAERAEARSKVAATSCVLAGGLIGVPLARVLPGVAAQYSDFRSIYWVSVSGQYAVLSLLYFTLPEDAAPTMLYEKGAATTYAGTIRATINHALTEPLLIQSSLVTIASSATFGSSWVTATFLLSDSPHSFSTHQTGLFGLIGLAGVASSLLIGHSVDKILPPMVTVMSAVLMTLSQTIQLSFGGDSILAIIIAFLCLEVAWHVQQISLSATVSGISAESRTRLNTILMISICLGQAMGTSIGPKIFLAYGYRFAAVVHLARAAWQLLAFIL
ncbi:hypothetical protein BOTBODRAFT_177148 [Botryobasidium botryosum FD-172 SS1]|uniref:Major facilitator superfamily (MFS) profile domain-containing protein n=1 Tax=Botryobasidium botryosum (strain FD-172 SS1) TaxID=930990 RepID=A0A067M6X0_BOTB1|nr:hypothetical protein BOTBODRAFT_177148 [Botryobasidium botryosum FD-172 SS1]